MYGLLAIALLGLLLRFWRGDGELQLLLIAASPYLMLAAPVALFLALYSRRRQGAITALLLAGVCSASQLPAYVADDPPAHGVPVVAMTANLRLGLADAGQVVAAVRSHRVDVLMVQELTWPELARLHAAGLDQVLPYEVAHVGYAAEGTGLWSRYPLRDVGQLARVSLRSVTATVTVPGAARPVRLVALHVAGPVPDPSLWHNDMTQLPEQLGAVAGPDPVLVGGDFNATVQNVWFRDVLGSGFADATRQAGEGITPTYPADMTLLPPALAIDHVLTRGGAVATSVRSVSIAGSDHRALVVGVSVPAG